ncbi:hypothetical protein IEQ34_009950 [Dendrobium chrysotoxum]|uniref:Small auxin up regulated protein n=1 Tax=Dendrobium chrysotoxum TaxID=161865 RepID=A0AAV7GKJ0_DENCH|nr:hypothetical protein IEQ34_009950 [Dendrobium chrysotoxum]
MEKIWQIVNLKRMMRRWRALILRSSDTSSHPTRLGYAVVYVGSDRWRCEIPARYLNLPVIAGLLEKAEEEFGGAQPSGGLLLPCEPLFFRWVLQLLGRDESQFRGLGLEAFSRLYAYLASAGDYSTSMATKRHSQSLPTLQAAMV